MKKSFYQKFLYISYVLENNIILESIKRGFLMTLPVLFIGAIALVITSFPIESFQYFIHNFGHGYIFQFFDVIYKVTYGLLSLYLTMNISYNYSKRLLSSHVFCQHISVTFSIICLAQALGIGGKDFSWEAFGNTGTFTAIVVAVVVPSMFYFILKRMKDVDAKSTLMLDEIDYQHMNTIFMPSFCCIFFFGIINLLLVQIWGISSLNALFASFFGYIFKSLGPNLFSGLLFVFLSGLLWFFGIHGGNTLELVSQNVFVPANTMPDTIISKSFIDVFGLMGGCGTTICLLIACLLFSRKKTTKNLARASVAMVTFNVNEILVFGLPIMFNPVMFIPFLLTPLVCISIAYSAVLLGIMPITTTTVAWTTPVLFSGYFLTGTLAGTLVQLISIIAGVLIYAPFVRLMEKVEKEKSDFLINEIEDHFRKALDQGETLNLQNLRNGLDRMYHFMVVELEKDIHNNSIPVYYQPQMDVHENMIGAEALLRWRYQGKQTFPPFVVELAKEEGLMNLLSMKILHQSCIDTQKLVEIYPAFKMSVNMVGGQMNEREFVEQVLWMIKSFHLEKNICLEITEETNLANLDYIIANIEYLKSHGIRMALDDFSMGHTSLKYLQQNLFDYVKLDGALVRDMMENERSETIVKSIVELGSTLNFHVIAEYVDTEEKRDRLVKLGCEYLQGYLYSPAVPVEKLLPKSQEQD